MGEIFSQGKGLVGDFTKSVVVSSAKNMKSLISLPGRALDDVKKAAGFVNEKLVPASEKAVKDFGKVLQNTGEDLKGLIRQGEVVTDKGFGFKIGNDIKLSDVGNNFKNGVRDIGDNFVKAVKSGDTGLSNRSKILNVGDDILDIMESNGGHTLDRHVGKSKEYLEERVGNMRQGADGATSFSDKNKAIKATKDVLNQNIDKIDDWLINGKSNRLTLKTEHDFSVGYGVLKNSGEYVDNISKTVTVIQKTTDNDLGFKIITCYPKLN